MIKDLVSIINLIHSKLNFLDIFSYLPPDTLEICQNLLGEIGEDINDTSSAKQWVPTLGLRRFEIRYERLRELLTAHPGPIAVYRNPTKESGLVPQVLLDRFGGEEIVDEVETLDIQGADMVEADVGVEERFRQDLHSLELEDD